MITAEISNVEIMETNPKLLFKNSLPTVPTMIVQPYVENAIEHGLRTKQQGHIKVIFALYDDEDIIMCIVEDNGIGRKRAMQLKLQDPQYQNHRSKGTIITEERLNLLHSTSKENQVFVETIDLKDETSNLPAGTMVKIKIPIVEIKIK